MSTRRLIFIVVPVVLAVVLAAALQLHRGSLTAEQVARHERSLTSTDPEQRLAAAAMILHAQPHRADARVVQAQALLELGRPDDARQALEPLAQASPVAAVGVDRRQVLTLLSNCYLAEAQQIILAGTRAPMDVSDEELEEVLGRAESARRMLESMPNAAAAAATLHAQELLTRAELARVQTLALSVELAKARTAGINEQIEVLGAQLAEVRRRAEQLRGQAVSLCQQVIQQQPGDTRPMELLLRTHLADGRLDRALPVADAIAVTPSLTHRAAGACAMLLLEAERLFQLPVTAECLARVESLLDAPSLAGAVTLDFRIARAQLAMAQQRYGDAAALASELLSTYDHHPRALCLLTQALVEQGQASAAIAKLVPAVERLRDPQLLLSLARARLAKGEGMAAAELLRSSLELEPTNIAARVAMVEALMASGQAGVAQQDTVILATLAARHPRVQALQAKLLVKNTDRAALTRLVLDRGLDAKLLGAWHGPAAVAATALDDTARVAAILETWPADGDALRPVVAAWLDAPANSRVALASILTRAMAHCASADPMSRALPARAPRLNAVELDKSATPAAMLAPGRIQRFFGTPEQAALDVALSALELWPDAAALHELAVELRLVTGDADAVAVDALSRDSVGSSAWRERLGSLLREGAQPPPPNADAAPIDRWLHLCRVLRGDDVALKARALEEVLTAYPGWGSAVMLALRDAMKRGDSAGADAVLKAAAQVNPRLASLCAARALLVTGHVTDALAELEKSVQDEDGATELRAEVTEARAVAYLVHGRPEQAVAVMETLMLSRPDQRLSLQVAAVDALIEGGKEQPAATLLAVILGSTDSSPSAIDAALSRGEVVIPAARLEGIIDTILPLRPGEPLIPLAKARLLIARGDTQAAEPLVLDVLAKNPGSPRAEMALAQLRAAEGRADEARRVLDRLLERGGRTAEAAAQELQKLGAEPKPTAPEPSTPQQAEPGDGGTP